MTAETYTEVKRGGRKFYKQLLALQDNLFLRAMREEKDNAKCAACARAWEVLEERKRIMRGKLKAGSFNATADQVGKRKSSRPASVTPDVVQHRVFRVREEQRVASPTPPTPAPTPAPAPPLAPPEPDSLK